MNRTTLSMKQGANQVWKRGQLNACILPFTASGLTSRLWGILLPHLNLVDVVKHLQTEICRFMSWTCISQTLIYSWFSPRRITQMVPVVCAPKLTSTLQQMAGEQSTNSSVLAVSNLFVRMSKRVGPIKQKSAHLYFTSKKDSSN